MSDELNPPNRARIQNTAGMAVYDIDPESIEVVEWHPLPDGQGRPTEVHLLFRVSGAPHPCAIRFKGPHTIGQIIGALRRHRNSVWPGAKEPQP